MNGSISDMADPGLLDWHADGHWIGFTLSGPELLVNAEPCPYSLIHDADCQINGKCVFQYFVDIYGVDANVGTVPMGERVEFAWSVQGDIKDFDAAQLWIIPVDDATFGPWLASFDV